MSRSTILTFLGVLVILSPFAGLPQAMLSWILPILGGLISFIALSYRTSTMSTASTDIGSAQENS